MVVKFITSGTLVMALAGGLIILAVRRDYREADRLHPGTVAAVWGLYGLHLTLIIPSALFGIWPLGTSTQIRWGLGAPLAAGGVAIAALAVARFRSFDLMSGRSTDRLVSGGIYGWSRNPQNVGWALATFGLAWIGGSALGLIQAAIFWALFASYVSIEESFLACTHGNTYTVYAERVPRYFGWPSEPKVGEEAGHG
jgi:protein-S-isoprenylcysteine O-methyltransferase Ste14